jgi:broad specificity phosphatase PhoE
MAHDPPNEPPRVVLVRHGRSAHAPLGWVDADGLRRWLAAYDVAGITPDDAPPAALRALASNGALVVASDLPRAVASAERLAPGAPAHASPLLRETPLPIPALLGLRLPIGGWALAMGAGMAYRRLRRVPHPDGALAQSASAAAWLAGLAGEHRLVLAVTHSNVRGLVAGALMAAGWRREPGGGRFAHWSAWTFTTDSTR